MYGSKFMCALLLVTTLGLSLSSFVSANTPAELNSYSPTLSVRSSDTADRTTHAVVSSSHGQLAPSTSKSMYALNEPVDLRVTNMGFGTVEFTNQCYFEGIFWVYNQQMQVVYQGPTICLPYMDPVFIYPFQSRSSTWQQHVPPGTYYFAVDGQLPYAQFIVMPGPPSSISEAKRLGDGSFVVLAAEVVTYASASAFYLESGSRACGVRVEKAGHGLAVGMKAQVSGTMRTNADGERYIEPWEVAQDGTGAVDPIGMINRALGGRRWNYNCSTHAGQRGVAGGVGLNNIGLWVRTWGVVTQKGADYLYLDDGSDLRDGTATGVDEKVGVRVMCDPAAYVPGDKVEVDGISSCFKTPSGTVVRRILIRQAEDVRKIAEP